MLKGRQSPHYSPYQMELEYLKKRRNYSRKGFINTSKGFNNQGISITSPAVELTKKNKSNLLNRVWSFYKNLKVDESKNNQLVPTKNCLEKKSNTKNMDAEVDQEGFAHQLFPLHKPIFAFSKYDVFTLSDATQGVQIFGATGSGKTTGSGAFVAKSYLSSGFGGLILTVKPDEKEIWQKYCQQTGRELAIFNLDNPWRFNFLEYEMKRSNGGGKTENIVDLFFSILELDVNDRNDKGERYWDKALKQLLRNTIDLAKLSDEKVDLHTLYKIILSAPQTAQDLKPTSKNRLSKWWDELCGSKILLVQKRIAEGKLSQMEIQDFEMVKDYFLKEYPAIAEKTRSIIVSSFTGMADMFLRGDLRELFCTETNFLPEFIHEGMVMLIDLPVKNYRKLGQYAQTVLKYCFQQATETRQSNDTTKPVFIWADEAQYFINSQDAMFQTTARSSRACTVYLTQNLTNFESQLGKLSHSLLGNLQTKIFHQNTDHITNNYASNLIGKSYQEKITSSQNHNSQNQEKEQMQMTFGTSSTLELKHELEPIQFSRLAKGGMEYNYIVEAIIYSSGRIWDINGRSFLKVEFEQGVG